MLSQSGRPIAHLDIKLENCLINPETQKVSLCDYGFATYDPLKIVKKQIGTEAYFPTYQSREDLASKSFTAEEIDIFALKIACYRPPVLKYAEYDTEEKAYVTKIFETVNECGQICNHHYSILPFSLLERFGLLSYFVTKKEKGEYHSALFLTHTLILALTNQTHLISHDVLFQRALVQLYLDKNISAKTINEVFSDNDYRETLSSKLPEHKLPERSVPIAEKDELEQERSCPSKPVEKVEPERSVPTPPKEKIAQLEIDLMLPPHQRFTRSTIKQRKPKSKPPAPKHSPRCCSVM